MRWAAVVILPLGCITVACTSSTSSRAAPTTTAPTTTVAATAAPTTTVALAPQPSPDVAANALLNAWHAGDRASATRVATAGAVAAVFAHPAADFSDRGCQDPVGGQASCAFGIGSGLLTVHTLSSAGGWLVDQVTFE